jgi:hypothetical protein
MFENTPLPRPHGIEKPSFWETYLPEWLINFFVQAWNFVDGHILWFIAGIVIILIIKFAYDSQRKDRKQVEKIWKYILFFLAKRQMIIPLVATLAKRDNAISKETYAQLLSLRDKCRNTSLREKPTDRHLLEEDISQILFEYFSSLEKKGKITPGSKLERVIKDLEFIDQKLVQLQAVYNCEVTRWNNKTEGLLGGFLKLFQLRKLDPFSGK